MKLIKINMELLIDDNIGLMANGIYNKDFIASYLNNKLYNDPEFFGELTVENIEGIEDWQ